MSQYIPYEKQENIEIPLYGEIERLSWTDRNQTKEKILQKLENYIEVGILEDVPMNTYIRYLTLVNNRITLRFGGFLKRVENTYILLENHGNRWSVQRCFYKDKEPIFYTRFFINKKYSYLLDRYNPKLNKVKDILIDKLKLDLDDIKEKTGERETKLVKQRKLLYHIVQDKDKELKIKQKELEECERELKSKDQELYQQRKTIKTIKKKNKKTMETEEELMKTEKELMETEEELNSKTKELKKMKSKMKKMKKFIREGI